MPRLDKELLKKLTHGKCFVILGSGVSIGSGYPSWIDLAKKVIDKLEQTSMMKATEITKIHQKMHDDSVENLLEIFEFISQRITKEKLVKTIEEIFSATDTQSNEIYSLISKWPINCYLTTNYDSEIKKYLLKEDEIFIEHGNNKNDFNLLTADVEKSIFKIHGTFNDFNNFVITKSDYENLLEDPKYEYWREKIKSVLHMCPIVLIGYSAKDPDFQEQLKRASRFANPSNPIYMFAADLTPDEIIEKSIKNNIKVIPYNTANGHHTALKSILSQYNKFLPKRNSNLIGKPEEILDATEFNSAVFIYTDMVFKDDKIISKALYNCVLNAIKNIKIIDEKNLVEKLKELRVTADSVNTQQAVKDLIQEGYINNEHGSLSLTQKGDELLNKSNSKVIEYREKFNIYCKWFLEKYDLEERITSNIIAKIRNGLEVLFKKRGIEIARKIFIDDTNDISMTFDMAYELEAITYGFTENEYDAFIDLIIEILQNPRKEVRDYLALICNAYFLYNILGHDSKARKERLNILKKNNIFVDSSILIPLFAIDCQNYKYANELFGLIKQETEKIYITERLLKEMLRHAEWAIDHFSEKKISSTDSFDVLMGQGGYKENLFIQGALLYAHQKGTTMYSSYFEACFGENYEKNLEDSIRKKISLLGINIMNLSDFKDNVENYELLISNYEENFLSIKSNRQKNDSYRSDFQCETEAELLALAQIESLNFLTQTSNLKKIDLSKKIQHWSPEGVYRFLQMNSSSINLDSLYDCMVSDMYNNGFSLLNAENLREIANPFVHQAELDIKEIQKLQNKEINKFLGKSLIESHKEDYSLPFYSEQIQNYALTLLREQKEYNDRAAEKLEQKRKEVSLSEKERLKFEKLQKKAELRQRKRTNKRKNKRRNGKK